MFTYDEAKPFQFQPCWYQKLEKDFFKQTHNKVDEQSKLFEEFVSDRFLKGSTRISAEILNYFRLTVNDKLFVWNILGVTEKDFKSNKYSKEQKAKLISEKKKIEEALNNDDLSYIQNLLKERLVIWFKFFFARVILHDIM